ncbi:MYB DNA-binding domain protein [Penicillium cinerascens]|uniref:MYB DNA-binding domain protein n=1 Tax=Penicillium cinerascens TaxID=70096 RepID=A0A9W9JJJ5_9EURO|nr:MYB DNA-binding domain protein [Penicillium cinerascens]KAJ5198125.1 MYB DNA-binding domain protein [Penicillium cinerascens]
MVAEETPASKYSTSVVPESPGNPEGNSNISGTTFLPQDSSFEDGEADPIVMVDELSDLQSAATRLMDLFVSNASDPRDIVDAAKRLTNPMSTQSKRLKPATHKLISAMKGFSRQVFIDVEQIKQLIPSVHPEGTAFPWSPSPILHKANCARLALDVLLATIGSHSPRHAIERLESQFPAPFLDAIVKRSQVKPIGASTAEKQTFELALEIRTQYFIKELERRQNEKDFDPQSILRGVFYDELALEDVDSKPEQGFLRGFKLAHTFEDENGRLPDRFQEDVVDRIGELEYDLVAEDGSTQIQNLKSASWTRFIQRTARFIYTRDKEIKVDLQQQPKIDEVDDLVRNEIERRGSGTSRETPEPRQSVVSVSVDRSVHETPARQAREPPRQTSSIASRDQTREPLGENNLSFPPASPQTPFGLSGQASRPEKPPLKHSEQRKPNKRLRMLERSMNQLKRKETERHEQELLHLESQHASRLSTTSERPSFNMSASRTRDEVPQSPQPDSSQPRYPPAGSIASEDQDLNFRNEDESFNLNTLETEAEVTASPVIKRTNPRDLYFARSSQAQHQSPQHLGSQHQRSSPQLASDKWNELVRSQPQPAQPRAFIDRQANATRVSWGESVDDNPPSAQRPREEVAAPTSTSTRTLKRPRIDSDDSDSDEPFVRDERSIDPAHRRAQKPHQTHVDKRMRRDSSNHSPAADQLQQALTASSQAQRPASTQPSSPPPATQERWPQKNRQDTERPARPKNNNKRTNRFTEEQNQRLIHLVGEFGTSWSKILREDGLCPDSHGGPMFTGRTQVNLKDRARNIRRDYTNRGEPLPKNFEKVAK